MKRRFGRYLSSTSSRFRRDHSGAALIYFTAALPVIIGVALLAVDVGRLSTLQSSLQHGADALALAGAGELDFRSDAIARAESAIANLVVTNKSMFDTLQGEDGTEIVAADIDTCYLASLPASDSDAVGDCLDKEEDSSSARFVQVVVKPKTYDTIFPANWASTASGNQLETSAEAVAGFDAAVCNFTPMFMCNPFEPADAEVNDPDNVFNPYGVYDYVETRENRRRQIAFKNQKNQWGPGNFGFLQVNGGSGAKTLAATILSVVPEACFKLKDLSTQTGNIQVLRKAFNVRFDLYQGTLPGGEKSTDYPPAPNVRKGYYVPKKPGGGKVDQCTAVADTTGTIAMGFGIDNCFKSTPSNCLSVGGVTNSRIGGGDWDFDGYWEFNYKQGGSTPSKPLDETGTSFSNTNRPSRYEIYMHEIERESPNLLTRGKSPKPAAAEVAETGLPGCYKGTEETVAQRRIIYGAIVNCRANDVGGKTTGIQAVAFGKFFMTNPMDESAIAGTSPPEYKYTLWTELVDIVKPGDADGVARDIVQLYR